VYILTELGRGAWHGQNPPQPGSDWDPYTPQEVGGTLIGEDRLMVMAGVESVELYQIHQTHGLYVFYAIPFTPFQPLS
jgi:hypothetical protein